MHLTITKTCFLHTCFALSIVVASCPQVRGDDDGPADIVDGEAHARGAIVLRAVVPGNVRVKPISGYDIQWSADGETYFPLLCGSARPWNLFQSIVSNTEHTEIVIPVLGAFEAGEPQFIFDSAGRYEIRWKVTIVGQEREPMEIAQTLFVKPAVEADSAFMARISNGELLLALFGQNAFSEDVRERLLLPSAHDFRALTVIGELLKATRGSEFGSGMSAPKSAEEVRRWADTMWALAREIPDSSYSPYAAYYAGCCYAVLGLERAREVERAQREGGVPKGNVTQFQRRSAAFREDATSTAAREAFLFANERGDAYLKPRAIYQRAVISLWLDRREEMNNLLDAALTEAPGEQTIREWVITLRNDKLLDKLEAESNNP